MGFDSITIADWQSQYVTRERQYSIFLSFSSRVSSDFMQSPITFYIYGAKGELRMRGLKPRENERIRIPKLPVSVSPVTYDAFDFLF